MVRNFTSPDLDRLLINAFRLQPWAVDMLADRLRACILERGARVVSYQWAIEPLSRNKDICTTVGVTKNMYLYTKSAVDP